MPGTVSPDPETATDPPLGARIVAEGPVSLTVTGMTKPQPPTGANTGRVAPSHRRWLAVLTVAGLVLLAGSLVSLADLSAPSALTSPGVTTSSSSLASCDEDRANRPECIRVELQRLVASGDHNAVVRGTAALDSDGVDQECSQIALEVGRDYALAWWKERPDDITGPAAYLNAEGCHTGLLFGLYEALAQRQPDLTAPLWSSLVTWCTSNMAAFETHRTDCQTPLGHAVYRTNPDPEQAVALCDTIVPETAAAVRTGCSFGVFVLHLQSATLDTLADFNSLCVATASSSPAVQRGCAQAAGMYLGNLMVSGEQVTGGTSPSLSAIYDSCSSIGGSLVDCRERVLLSTAFALRNGNVDLGTFCAALPQADKCRTSASRWLS